MNKTYYSNDFNNKIKEFKNSGVNKLHILTDFDRTLTKGITKKATSVISKIRDSKYITNELKIEMSNLYNYYHPFEIDAQLSNAEKAKYMHEWYKKTTKVLIEHGLTDELIDKIVAESELEFRDGIDKFLETANKLNVPVIIISAGIGNLIEKYLVKNNLNFKNIQIISNFYTCDKNGYINKFLDPVIHPMNKFELQVRNFPSTENLISDRTNIIQMGDHIGDFNMAEGFNYTNLLTLAFLNKGSDETFEQFKKAADIVYTTEASLTEITNILKNI